MYFKFKAYVDQKDHILKLDMDSKMHNYHNLIGKETILSMYLVLHILLCNYLY